MQEVPWSLRSGNHQRAPAGILDAGQVRDPHPLDTTLHGGEGGCLVSDDQELVERAQILSLHGISKDAWKRYSSAGSWYYEVTAPGFAKQNKTANLTVAAETLVEIALRPGGSLVGIVSDESGQPIAEVEIRDAYSGPVSFGWKTKSAADGSYRLDNLPLRTKIFGIIYEKDGYVAVWADDIELTDSATPRKLSTLI